MKTNLGTSLSRAEMKQIQGGKYPGCATINEVAVAYTDGCCTGLSACGTSPLNHDLYCVPPNQCVCQDC
ncbi:hypothetical protein HDF24_22540 [Mucilaginibacter sp. X4EP1]|uniref:hypothetical protein n=1 Tax=Mucilaginibacter sp. X4EP1 TaxID=2723092 RepID=UPI002169F4CD|nr:hypothetical protein [Mucilaginibacter sp. X4EP1]MCS3812224.1 hypothetical protein [Mucilaginibacter sp. X4EP1]